jgi:hypothetical protein
MRPAATETPVPDGDPARTDLDARVLAWMAEWAAAPGAADAARDEARFDSLARELFAFQVARCAPWAHFCERRGVTAGRIASWREIPPVPAAAFKELALRSFPPERERKLFRTSGSSAARRGELHLDTLVLYEASVVPSFVVHLLPELARGDGRGAARFTLRILAPPPEEAPDSSLSHMFGVLRRALAPHLDPATSGFDVRGGALDLPPLLGALARSIETATPLLLCGTAFAFVHLVDALAAQGARLRLPAGSRVFETGGFKGRSRSLSRAALYAAIEAALGVPPERIVNQYGMTELASQFHDSVLRFPGAPRRKLGPPWARARIIDPLSGAEVAHGCTGVISIVDLASTATVCALQSEDLGRALDDGFEVLGRAEGSDARGCSIALDEMLGRGGEQ